MGGTFKGTGTTLSFSSEIPETLDADGFSELEFTEVGDVVTVIEETACDEKYSFEVDSVDDFFVGQSVSLAVDGFIPIDYRVVEIIGNRVHVVCE